MVEYLRCKKEIEVYGDDRSVLMIICDRRGNSQWVVCGMMR